MMLRHQDIKVPDDQLSYEALTESNERLRVERGWTDVDLDAALTAEQRERFIQWQTRQRIPWDVNDLLIVGFAPSSVRLPVVRHGPGQDR